MADVVDLGAIRALREGPDPEHRFRDAQGAEWYRFLVEFVADDGDRFCFDIWAFDHEDAEKRLAALKRSAVVLGQMHTTVEG